LAKKPTTTSACVPAVYDGKIYLFGGFYSDEGPGSSDVIYRTVEAYDPSSNTWQSVTEMPKTLANPAIAVYGGKAYIIGGYNADAGKLNREVMVYDFASKTWTRNYCTMPAKIARVFSYASVTPVVDGIVYLVGGSVFDIENDVTSNKVTLFDIESCKWKNGPSLPKPRDNHFTALCQSTLFVIGGYQNSENLNRAKSTVWSATLPLSNWRLLDNFSGSEVDLTKWDQAWHTAEASAPAVTNKKLVLVGTDTDGASPDYAENGIETAMVCSGLKADLNFVSCVTNHNPGLGESPFGQLEMEAELTDASGTEYEVAIELTEEGSGVSGEVELTSNETTLQAWEFDASYNTKYTFRIQIDGNLLNIYRDHTLVASYTVDPTTKIIEFGFEGVGIFCSYEGNVDNVFTTSNNRIAVTTPASDSQWLTGNNYKIKWLTGDPSSNVKVFLFKGGSKVATLTASTANDGIWKWAVPNDLSRGDDYKVKVVCLENASVSGFSDPFEIRWPGDDYTPIAVTLPTAALVWTMGSDYSIEWTGGQGPEAGMGTEVKIKLYKGKKAVKTIAASTENNGQLTWTVPYTLAAGTNYRVKVISSDYGYVKGASQKFEIKIPPINLTAPTAGTQWKRGYTYPIRWTGGKPTANVKIQLIKPDNKVAKVITSSTANDGLFKWKVPFNTPLSSSYRVRVVYLPDTTMRDTSEVFSVINSPIGTWRGRWYDDGIGAPVEIKVNKNGTLSGWFVQPLEHYGSSGNATLYFTGNYTYNESTGDISFNVNGQIRVQGYLFRARENGQGTCVNNTFSGSYTGTYDVYDSGQWWIYDYLGGNFTLKR
jgi:5-hydroxyisourate hydrolase-like protein (transthyretin family)